MLRQDVDGGAVALAGFLNDGGCYVDECVLPGTYRYGCEMPLPCACGAPTYWESATVTESIVGGCDSPPTPVSGGPPWPADTQDVSCPPAEGGSGCSTAGSVFAFDGSTLLLSLALLWRSRRGQRPQP
jgi:hypothetical protein